MDDLHFIFQRTDFWRTRTPEGYKFYHVAQAGLQITTLAYLVLAEDHAGQQFLSSFLLNRPCNDKRLNLELFFL